MKRLAALVITLSVLTVACGKRQSDSAYLNSYQLVIDPSFTPTQVEGMMQASWSWEAKVPVQFTWIIGPCDKGPSYGQICVSQWNSSIPLTVVINGAVSDIDGMTYMMGSTDRIYMYPRTEMAGDDFFFEQTFQHELGHAQGLRHHSGCFVMNPTLTECAVIPSTDDVDQWYSIERKYQ